MLASASPSHRVEGLEEAGLLAPAEAGSEGEMEGEESALRPRGQAAMVLGYLERLGEPYGPPAVSLFGAQAIGSSELSL